MSYPLIEIRLKNSEEIKDRSSPIVFLPKLNIINSINDENNNKEDDKLNEFKQFNRSNSDYSTTSTTSTSSTSSNNSLSLISSSSSASSLPSLDTTQPESVIITSPASIPPSVEETDESDTGKQNNRHNRTSIRSKLSLTKFKLRYAEREQIKFDDNNNNNSITDEIIQYKSKPKIKIWDKVVSQLNKGGKKHREIGILNAVENQDINALKRYLSFEKIDEKVNNNFKRSDITLKNIRNATGYSPLCLAVSYGNYDMVRILLDYGVDINEVCTNNSVTALYLACDLNHTNIIEDILFRYIDSNNSNALLKPTANGYTPFHVACKNNNLEAVKLLWEHYKKIMNITDDRLCSYPMVVSENHEASIIKLDEDDYLINYSITLNNATDVYTPLIIASIYDSRDVAEYLLNENVNIFKEDNKGNTPLHYACIAGNYTIVSLLINAGNDSYMPNCDEETPYDLARKYGHKSIVDLIEIESEKQTNPGYRDALLHMRQYETGNLLNEECSLYTKEQLQELTNNAFEYEKNKLTSRLMDAYSVTSPSSSNKRLQDPSFLRVLVKNRMKYAQYFILGSIDEQKSITCEDPRSVFLAEESIGNRSSCA